MDLRLEREEACTGWGRGDICHVLLGFATGLHHRQSILCSLSIYLPPKIAAVLEEDRQPAFLGDEELVGGQKREGAALRHQPQTAGFWILGPGWQG